MVTVPESVIGTVIAETTKSWNDYIADNLERAVAEGNAQLIAFYESLHCNGCC